MKLILIFSMIWLVIMFIILPFGIKVPENVPKGFADSAPSQHYLGIKLVASMIVSIVLTIFYWYIFL